MKIILTSAIFMNDIVTKAVFKHINKPMKDCKILFIPNQKATKEKLNSRKYIDRVIAWGFSKENIYIFNKYEHEKYKNLNIDLLVITGGNTFGTLDLIRKSFFEQEIINYIKKGVIFIGGSAGSHVVTKNIEHVSKYDSNDCGLKDYNAIGLFDGILVCHYDESRKDDYYKLRLENKFKVYSLTNNEFIIYDGNIVKKYCV